MSQSNKIIVNNIVKGDNVIDFCNVNSNEILLNNEVNSQSSLTITEIGDVGTLKITVNEGSYLKLSILFDSVKRPLKLVINVKNNAVLETFFAELSTFNFNFDCEINLLEENASAYVKLASLSTDDNNKEININVNHMVAKTYGKVDNYGVCKDNGKLLFAGTSYIYKNAIKSKTQQNARIMVFDEASNGIAKPILKIDENDIEASHAAIVGKINDEHLFYLTSRGISEAEAKHLITMGYLNPILAGFSDEKKEYISSLIERRM